MTARAGSWLAGAAAALTLLAGCTLTGADADSADTVTVFAAASLTEPFQAIADRFEQRDSGVDVRLVFGPSPELARQIVSGAHADVYAAASVDSVNALIAATLVDGKPAVFARNHLALAVPTENQVRVTSISDLARPDVTFAQCAPEVPCGVAAGRILAGAVPGAKPVTYERDVKAVLAKVVLGEVDAGLVYRSDIRAEERRGGTPRVTGIDISGAAAAANAYPIAVVRSTRNRTHARQFVDFVLSPDGRAALAEAGFDAP